MAEQKETIRREFQVTPNDAGERLDRFLSARLPELSRTRVQELIAGGHVRVDGRTSRSSHRLKSDQKLDVVVLPRPAAVAAPEQIPLDLLFEDEDVIVVNKPAGMAVHLGAGLNRGTLVNALLGRAALLSGVGGPTRPGIVHRLDKDTSGVLIVARTDAAHSHLAAQFSRRTVVKKYVALVHGRLPRETGSIRLPIARDTKRRTRMTTRVSAAGRARSAETRWRTLARLDGFTLLEADLLTGRTHQIRVHFSALGHPIVGDTLYGAPRQVRAGRIVLSPLGRNFLHAARIQFEHPRRTGFRVDVRAPLPAELRDYLKRLAEALGAGPGAFDAAAREYL